MLCSKCGQDVSYRIKVNHTGDWTTEDGCPRSFDEDEMWCLTCVYYEAKRPIFEAFRKERGLPELIDIE